MISGGTIKMRMRRVYYDSGMAETEEQPISFLAKKSIQPLEPEEAQTRGFPDYSTNQFITIYSLKKIPMPSKNLESIIITFNKKDWYVRKVLPLYGMKELQWNWDIMKLSYLALTRTISIQIKGDQND